MKQSLRDLEIFCQDIQAVFGTQQGQRVLKRLKSGSAGIIFNPDALTLARNAGQADLIAEIEDLLRPDALAEIRKELDDLEDQED